MGRRETDRGFGRTPLSVTGSAMPQAAVLQQDGAPEAAPLAGERMALFSQIEEALKTATERERARIFTATKRLFLRYATTLDGEGLALFDDLFMRQTDGVD